MPADLVTLPNIELVSTGTWQASTGEVTFTEGDLQAILASIDDPAVKEPRLIIGHTPPTAPPSFSGQDGFFGEQPTIGRFTNIRSAENGQTLVGDLIGVPSWLAEILPTAYPNRSVEVYWNVTSATGKEHSAVMPRIAVLGINLPAVATLEDLQAMYSEEGPEGIQLTHVGERVAASRGDQMPERTAASTSMEDVRRAFYDDFATSESDRYWWWIRNVFVNPSILIVDDDDGSLYAVPWSTSGDSVEFGEPAEVFTQYVEKDSGKVAAQRAAREALLRNADRTYNNAAESRPDNRPKEVEKMAIDIAVLRSRTGLSAEQLPDDATEEQINAALLAQPETPPAGGDAGDDEDDDDDAGSEGEGVQAQGVTVDPEAFAQMQRDAQAGREARAEQLNSARASYIDDAIKRGKFPPSSRASYLSQMERGGDIEKSTREFIDKLAENAVPVGETGDGGDGSEAATQAAEYPVEWLAPGERARVEAARAAAAEGRQLETPTVVQEA